MLNRFLRTSCLTFCVIVSVSHSAAAQECNTNYEMVTKLFHPNPGSYATWDTNYGEDDKQEIFDSVVLPIDSDQGVIAAGTSAAESEEGALNLLLARLDNRGRSVWETVQKVEGLKSVVKILQRAEGYISLANINQGVWIGFISPEGKVLSSQILKGSIEATDILADANGKGWILAINKRQDVGHGETKSVHLTGSVYKIDTAGKVIWSRDYAMGGDSEILGLSKMTLKDGKNAFFATGYLKNNTGKKMGLALRLDTEGGIIWQQEFNRGLNAALSLSSGLISRYLLVFGDVRPIDAGTVGSWLMLLDADTGIVQWQRYYEAEKGLHHYFARGLYVNTDNLITLMMAANVVEDEKPRVEKGDVKESGPKESGKDSPGSAPIAGDINIPDTTDYVHLLTLSPRGITMSGDSYFQGDSVAPRQLIEGAGRERIIAGYTKAAPSAAFLARNFTPDWESPEFGGEQEVKAESDKQPPKPHLPDAAVPESSKSGLALLNQKLKAQVGKADNKQSDSDKIEDGVQQKIESVSGVSSQKLSKNGWVVVGEAPPPYVDPCKNPSTDLPKQK